MPAATDPPPLGGRRARWRRALRRTVLSRRRPLAALCAGAAVLAGIQATRPPPPPTVAVTVASRDLPGGTVLTRRDLEVRRLPAGVAPVGSDLHAMGRTLAAPVRRGEPVTDVRLIGPGLAAAYPDRVVLPVRIADAEAADLLQVGDRVDLVAADPRGGRASYVAVDVPVLAVPTPSDDSSTSGPGSGLTGRLVVVAALPDDIGRIAGAAATDLMSVAISR